jgi:4-amino-4-deoxy-L-arabinose transferase-like glycosyltransferase
MVKSQTEGAWTVGPLIVGVALFGAFVWLASRATPLWFDEIFTAYVAREAGSVRDLIGSMGAGIENHPPGYYLLARWSEWLFGQSTLALRLPAAAGVLCCLLAVWVAIARRHRKDLAALAVGTLLCTPAFATAIEARPYALLLAAAACCFLFWDMTRERDSWQGAVCVSVTLVAGMWTHYYGVFLLVPLVLAEATYVMSGWTRRRMLCGIVGVACSALLLGLYALRVSGGFRATFWAAPGSPGEIADAYNGILRPVPLLALAVALPALLWGASIAPRRSPDAATGRARLAFLLGGLGLVPLIWVAAAVYTNAFHYKYVLFVAVYLALALPEVLERASGCTPTRVWTAAAGLACLAPYAYFAGSGSALRPYWQEIAARDALVQAATRDSPLPLVFEEPFSFLQYFYHTRGGPNRRIHYLLDVELSDPGRLSATTPPRRHSRGCEDSSRFRRQSFRPLCVATPASCWSGTPVGPSGC